MQIMQVNEKELSARGSKSSINSYLVHLLLFMGLLLASIMLTFCLDAWNSWAYSFTIVL